MAIASRVRFLYLAHLSKPYKDRVIYHGIRRFRAKRILELGVELGVRAQRMIELATEHASAAAVEYIGVDLFEARGPKDGAGLSIRAAHQTLRKTGAAIRLCPGDPATALSRVANSLGQVDLVVVSAGHEPASLNGAWFFVPRILHDRSLVFVEEGQPSEGDTAFRLLGRAEVLALAAGRRVKRAA